MSANSYPSPISSAPSPRLNGSPGPLPLPSIQEQAGPQRAPRLRPHARSLETAAADLEVAFARLEQVRMSLMALSNRMGETGAQSRARRQIGPDHDAILLTEDSRTDDDGSPRYQRPLDREGSNRSTQEEGAFFAQQAYQDQFRRASLAQQMARDSLARLQAERHLALSSRSASPPNPSSGLRNQTLPTPPPPQSLPSRQIPSPLRDDGYTIAGRGATTQESLRRRPTELIDDLVNAPPLSPLQPAGARPPPNEDSGAPSQRPSLTGSMESQNQLASPASSPLLWRQDPARRNLRRPMRTETRLPPPRAAGSGPVSSIPSDPSRLSMLSSFSIQNFSGPASAAPSFTRNLIFEEPESYSDSPPLAPVPFEADLPLDDASFPNRNYIIRRQINSDGRERVQNVDLTSLGLDLNDMPMYDPNMDPLRQRTMLQNFQLQRLRASPPMSLPVSRRRGWDADGNEIPSDEEEELERVRTEYRIRATARERPGFSMSMDSMNPRTPSDVGGPQRVPAGYGTVTDSVASVRDSRRSHYTQPQSRGSVSAKDSEGYLMDDYYPLPMPLEGMVEKRGSDTMAQASVVFMDPSCSLAGR